MKRGMLLVGRGRGRALVGRGFLPVLELPVMPHLPKLSWLRDDEWWPRSHQIQSQLAGMGHVMLEGGLVGP